MLSLEGVPGIYLHSLLGTQNDMERVQLSNHNRDINRKKWDVDELTLLLNNEKSHHSRVLNALTSLLKIRRRQPAFHPNAVQYTLHLGSQVFAFWRQSADRDQSIFCIHNVTDQEVKIPITSVNLISLQKWKDLITGTHFSDQQDHIVLQAYQFVWLSNKV